MENLRSAKVGDFIVYNNYLVKVLANDLHHFAQIIYKTPDYIVEKYNLKKPVDFEIGAQMEITSFCQQYKIDKSTIMKSSQNQRYIYVWGWPGFLNSIVNENNYFLREQDNQWCKKYYSTWRSIIHKINKELI